MCERLVQLRRHCWWWVLPVRVRMRVELCSDRVSHRGVGVGFTDRGQGTTSAAGPECILFDVPGRREDAWNQRFGDDLAILILVSLLLDDLNECYEPCTM